MNVITKYKIDKKFHTTLINCIFQFKCSKEEIMAYTILSKLLSKTNMNYPEIDLYAKAKLNNYIINLNVLSQSINDVYFLNFSMLIPNENLIENYDIKDSINFLLDTIYKPNILNEELFNIEKRLYIENLLNSYKNVEFIAEKNMLDLLDQECKFNKIKYKDLDNINNLTLNDVINFYNKYIKSFKPKIFIYGNTSIKKINNVFVDYIKNMSLKEYNIINKYNSFYEDYNFINKTENSKFQQSIVYMVYNIKKYKVGDFYKLYLLNLILSDPSSNILFNNLRKKNNLVYSCGSYIMIRNGLLIIKALTSKNKIKLTKAIITKTLNRLNTPVDYKDNITRILQRLNNNIRREKDNFFIKPTDIINDYFKSDESSEKTLEILNNIKLEELKEVITRLEIKCSYTLEGV